MKLKTIYLNFLSRTFLKADICFPIWVYLRFKSIFFFWISVVPDVGLVLSQALGTIFSGSRHPGTGYPLEVLPVFRAILHPERPISLKCPGCQNSREVHRGVICDDFVWTFHVGFLKFHFCLNRPWTVSSPYTILRLSCRENLSSGKVLHLHLCINHNGDYILPGPLSA